MLKYCYLLAFLYFLIPECGEVQWRCSQEVKNCQINICRRRSSGSNSFWCICMGPRITEGKNEGWRARTLYVRISVFLPRNYDYCQRPVFLLQNVFGLGVFLLCVCCLALFDISIKGETFRQLFRQVMSRCWCSGGSRNHCQSHHHVCLSLCLWERGFCTF